MPEHRIAITGSSSVGKTTLADALMRSSRFKSLATTFVPEGARPLLTSMGRTSFDLLTREELRDFQRLFFLAKQRAESQHNSFLVDRSFVDVAAIWIERDTFDLPDLQLELVAPCKVLAEKYTLHIHVPIGAVAFHQDGQRESDLELHRRVAKRVATLLEEWNLPHVTLKAATTDARVLEVLAMVGLNHVELDPKK